MCKVSSTLSIFLWAIIISVIVIFNVNAEEACAECNVIDKRDFEYVVYGDIPEPIINRLNDQLQISKAMLQSYFHVEDLSKVTIRIWSEHNDFLDEQKKLFGVSWPNSLGYVTHDELRLLFNPKINEIAEHELVHLITLKINPSFGNNPRWLWEAIAIYKSEDSWIYAESPELISNRFDLLSSQLNDEFNQSHAIYELGYTIGEYIEKTWGKEAIMTLIKNNGDVNMVTDKSLDELLVDWKQFVKKTYFL